MPQRPTPKPQTTRRPTPAAPTPSTPTPTGPVPMTPPAPVAQTEETSVTEPQPEPVVDAGGHVYDDLAFEAVSDEQVIAAHKARIDAAREAYRTGEGFVPVAAPLATEEPPVPHPATRPSAADQRAMAGPPEGVEPGSAGALAEGVDTPLGTQATNAAVADAEADTYVVSEYQAPEGHEREAPYPTPDLEFQEVTIHLPETPRERLQAYLSAHHGALLARTLPGGTEGPEDAAIRVMQHLSARAPVTAVIRCDSAYCNLPLGTTASTAGWPEVTWGQVVSLLEAGAVLFLVLAAALVLVIITGNLNRTPKDGGPDHQGVPEGAGVAEVSGEHPAPSPLSVLRDDLDGMRTEVASLQRDVAEVASMLRTMADRSTHVPGGRRSGDPVAEEVPDPLDPATTYPPPSDITSNINKQPRREVGGGSSVRVTPLGPVHPDSPLQPPPPAMAHDPWDCT